MTQIRSGHVERHCWVQAWALREMSFHLSIRLHSFTGSKPQHTVPIPEPTISFGQTYKTPLQGNVALQCCPRLQLNLQLKPTKVRFTLNVVLHIMSREGFNLLFMSRRFVTDHWKK